MVYMLHSQNIMLDKDRHIINLQTYSFSFISLNTYYMMLLDFLETS